MELNFPESGFRRWQIKNQHQKDQLEKKEHEERKERTKKKRKVCQLVRPIFVLDKAETKGLRRKKTRMREYGPRPLSLVFDVWFKQGFLPAFYGASDRRNKNVTNFSAKTWSAF